MRILVWLLRLFVFVLFLGFALRNDVPVSVNFYFGQQWNLPLVAVMLIAFALGVFAGVAALVPGLISKHRDLVRLRRLRGDISSVSGSHEAQEPRSL